MKKYIDSEQIEQNLHREEYGTPDERWIPESEIAQFIDNVPSADVVEVVRCKDCKRSTKHSEDIYKCGWLCAMTEPDFYCADGERKKTNV